jgi:hypothetical protein
MDLEDELSKCPKFKNLKSLYLDRWIVKTDFNLLSWLVHLSPNLEMLSLFSREVTIVRSLETHIFFSFIQILTWLHTQNRGVP